MYKANVSKELKILELLKMYENGEITFLSHQRPIKTFGLKESKSVLEHIKNGMAIPFQLADLKSICEVANQIPNLEIANALNSGAKYSLEDGQHRLAAIINLLGKHRHHFDSKEIEFFEQNATIPIVILKDIPYDNLVSRFSNTNSAKPMSNPEKYWNTNTDINYFFKSTVNDRDFLTKLKKKNGSPYGADETNRRKLYLVFAKSFKIMLYDCKLITSSKDGFEEMTVFLNSSKVEVYNQIKEFWTSLKPRYFTLIEKIGCAERAQTHHIVLLYLYLTKDSKTLIEDDFNTLLKILNSDSLSTNAKLVSKLDFMKKQLLHD